MIRRILLCGFASAMLTCLAQTTPEEVMDNVDFAGGVYYAYPVSTSENTAPPRGYKPFYISHYGRHGSRYLISDNDYIVFLEPMRKASAAGKLTPDGEKALALAEKVWLEAEGRGGELTPLGTRQQNGIAHRMYKSFPEVFAGEPEITACATTVMRVAQSMDAFAEGLKEMNPGLKIPREASQRNMYYLNYHSPESNAYTGDNGPWREAFRKFSREQVKPERLMKQLFNDSQYVYDNVDPERLMWALYWMAVDQQNVETPGSFYEFLTPQEMFDLWQVVNYDNYVRDANYPGSQGLVVSNAKPLLRNIVETADRVIAEGGNGATLRFGHDGNLMPLAAILQMEGSYNDNATTPQDGYKAYANFKIAPMAGNVQIVFFKDKKDDVIVKFMLNEREIAIPVETDMYPFYRWADVRAFYENILKD